MGVKVYVNTRPGNTVVVNQQRQTLVRTVGIGQPASVARVNDLLDVDVSNLSANDTLVYDETAGKWVAKPPVINGGEF